MKRNLLIILLAAGCLISQAQPGNYTTLENINYYPESVSETDEYIKERCVLDLYYPEEKNGYPTVVWFHGGGLTGGNKFTQKN